MGRRMTKVAALVVAGLVGLPGLVSPAGAEVRPIAPACTLPEETVGQFDDVPLSNPHAAAIDCIVHWKVTVGTGDRLYDPTGHVTRGQMASFIGRLSMWSDEEIPEVPDAFPDDNGNPHEHYINLLAAAGIVTGRPDGTYGPNELVQRDQMATFLVRALQFAMAEPIGEGAPDAFRDDDGNPHERNINKAAAVGLAGGTTATTFAPRAPVRRDQMASFLARGISEAVENGPFTVPPA